MSPSLLFTMPSVSPACPRAEDVSFIVVRSWDKIALIWLTVAGTPFNAEERSPLTDDSPSSDWLTSGSTVLSSCLRCLRSVLLLSLASCSSDFRVETEVFSAFCMAELPLLSEFSSSCREAFCCCRVAICWAIVLDKIVSSPMRSLSSLSCASRASFFLFRLEIVSTPLPSAVSTLLALVSNTPRLELAEIAASLSSDSLSDSALENCVEKSPSAERLCASRSDVSFSAAEPFFAARLTSSSALRAFVMEESDWLTASWNVFSSFWYCDRLSCTF